jgi:hypothetical protein
MLDDLMKGLAAFADDAGLVIFTGVGLRADDIRPVEQVLRRNALSNGIRQQGGGPGPTSAPAICRGQSRPSHRARAGLASTVNIGMGSSRICPEAFNEVEDDRFVRGSQDAAALNLARLPPGESAACRAGLAPLR